MRLGVRGAVDHLYVVVMRATLRNAANYPVANHPSAGSLLGV